MFAGPDFPEAAGAKLRGELPTGAPRNFQPDGRTPAERFLLAGTDGAFGLLAIGQRGERRELDDLRHAVAFGEIAVAHVLQDADAAAFTDEALEIRVVRAECIAIRRDAMPRFQIGGAADVGEKRTADRVSEPDMGGRV